MSELSKHERECAIMEGEAIGACDRYFAARPLADSVHARTMFESGFIASWKLFDQRIETLQDRVKELEEELRIQYRANNIPNSQLSAQQSAETFATKSAKKQFDEFCLWCDIELYPIERLRFFLSLALNCEDWLDVEPFIDAVDNTPQSLAEVKE